MVLISQKWSSSQALSKGQGVVLISSIIESLIVGSSVLKGM